MTFTPEQQKTVDEVGHLLALRLKTTGSIRPRKRHKGGRFPYTSWEIAAAHAVKFVYVDGLPKTPTELIVKIEQVMRDLNICDPPGRASLERFVRIIYELC